MATTKRDFEAIAAIIARRRKDCSTDERLVLVEVAEDMANYFASQNERFKREQFLAACDVLI